MRKIITALLAFMLTVTAVCSLASCKNENAPETGWKVQRYVVDSDNSDESVVSGEEYLHSLYQEGEQRLEQASSLPAP